MPAPGQPLLWDVYEEHLDEAGWLWGEWLRALDSPVYTLAEVASGPEERLHAHLDGLVLGGQPVAEKLLLPALGGEEPGLVAAAAWALLQAEHGDHQDAVVQVMKGAAPALQAAIGRALCLAPRADISRLIRLWRGGSPGVRAIVLDVFAPREPQWVRDRLTTSLRSGHAGLVAAALRAVRRLRDPAFADHVRFALPYPEPVVQREAMTCGLALGLKETWATCRTVAASPDDNGRLAMGLLAISPDAQDREWVLARLFEPAFRPHALWALGFAGDVKAVDALVEAMADAETGKLAGESFRAVTGVPVAGALSTPGTTAGPDEAEVSLDDPPPVVRPEDDLPQPSPEAVTRWWAKERPRFHPVVRYVDGQPRTSDALRAALTSASTWRREVLATELFMSAPSAPRIDLADWAKHQQRQLAQPMTAVPLDRKLLAMHQQTLRS